VGKLARPATGTDLCGHQLQGNEMSNNNNIIIIIINTNKSNNGYSNNNYRSTELKNPLVFQ